MTLDEYVEELRASGVSMLILDTSKKVSTLTAWQRPPAKKIIWLRGDNTLELMHECLRQAKEPAEGDTDHLFGDLL